MNAPLHATRPLLRAAACGLQALWCVAFRAWARAPRHMWVSAALLAAEAVTLGGAHRVLRTAVATTGMPSHAVPSLSAPTTPVHHTSHPHLELRRCCQLTYHGNETNHSSDPHVSSPGRFCEVS